MIQWDTLDYFQVFGDFGTNFIYNNDPDGLYFHLRCGKKWKLSMKIFVYKNFCIETMKYWIINFIANSLFTTNEQQ